VVQEAHSSKIRDLTAIQLGKFQAFVLVAPVALILLLGMNDIVRNANQELEIVIPLVVELASLVIPPMIPRKSVRPLSTRPADVFEALGLN
jgi:hypothetical protein